MKDQFPFLGLAAPERRAAQKMVLAGFDPPDEAGLDQLLRALWAEPEREFCYAATDLVRRWVGVASEGFVDCLRWAITTRSWWDSVDPLAPSVGALAVRYPAVVDELDRWNAQDNLWLVRVSIIYQLGRKQATDTDRLFANCAAQSTHPDFFVRKAIGWALRDYARTDPTAVRAFVSAHPELAPLSKREALKRVGGA